MGKGGDRSSKLADTPASPSKSTLLTSSREKTTPWTNARPEDFLWSATDEPHASRRKAILNKYPEIKKLYGIDVLLKYKIAGVVFAQFGMAYLFRHQFTQQAQYSNFVFFLAAYWIGGTCNHALFLAMHELAHNLGFKKPALNKWYSIFANLPLIIPSAITFKRYHMDHHKYQGVQGIDVDIPTPTEARLIRNCVSKFLFVCFQLVFYAVRPMFVNAKNPDSWTGTNVLVCLIVDAILLSTLGPSAVFYLLIASLFGGGLHPVAGHFIAEHYVFPGDEQETYSYYGICNLFTFNVGYHNEHHDFPYVPGCRLPEVRRIAAEFYEPLKVHKSYVVVIFQYIFNSKILPYSRVKRMKTGPDEGGVIADDAVEQKKGQ